MGEISTPSGSNRPWPRGFLVNPGGLRSRGATAHRLKACATGNVRVRRIEFAELPKTISGKIRRVELRAVEVEARKTEGRRAGEYWEEDFPEVK